MGLTQACHNFNLKDRKSIDVHAPRWQVTKWQKAKEMCTYTYLHALNLMAPILASQARHKLIYTCTQLYALTHY